MVGMCGVMIRDELYGTITLSDLEKEIIDTEDFQRLRRIKQMALTYLVYPCANHTRFEHSLGTMHVASQIADKLGMSKEKKEKLRLYALLHDIGHLAFSHESERVLSSILGSHEEIGKMKIMKGEIADVLKENYNPEEIATFGKTTDGQIVNSDIGADRIDYLRRDAYNTGVAYGIIDSDRIIHTLAIVNGELAIDERGIIAAESLLIARFMMFSTVYFHHTVRIAGAMLCRAIESALSTNSISAEEFLDKGDEELFLMLRNSDVSDYVNRLLKRQLFKEAYSFDTADVKKMEKNIREIEKNLSKTFGCQIIIDWPYDFFKPINFKVMTENGLVDIMKLSDLVSSLKISEERRKKVLLLCPPEARERVRREVVKELKKESILE
jgi:HD superfamily phosphohydrolase